MDFKNIIEHFDEGTIAFLTVTVLSIFLWYIPVRIGLKWAKIKGVSKLWMLFGIHPVGGWIACIVLKYGIEPRKQCLKCRESIMLEAQVCRYCGHLMDEKEINMAVAEFEKRKNNTTQNRPLNT